MKTTTIISPCFKWSEINKYKQPEGVIMTPQQAFEQNLLDLLHTYNMAHGDDNFVLICAKEKDGNDYKFNMACVPIENHDDDLICFEMFDFETIPTLVVNAKKDVFKIIQRILKSLIFS